MQKLKLMTESLTLGLSALYTEPLFVSDLTDELFLFPVIQEQVTKLQGAGDQMVQATNVIGKPTVSQGRWSVTWESCIVPPTLPTINDGALSLGRTLSHVLSADVYFGNLSNIHACDFNTCQIYNSAQWCGASSKGSRYHLPFTKLLGED